MSGKTVPFDDVLSHAQTNLGWYADFRTVAVDTTQTRIVLVLRDRGGGAFNSASVSACHERSNRSSADISTDLRLRSSVRYEALVDLPEPGIRNLHHLTVRGGDLFLADRRTVLR